MYHKLCSIPCIEALISIKRDSNYYTKAFILKYNKLSYRILFSFRETTKIFENAFVKFWLWHHLLKRTIELKCLKIDSLQNLAAPH